MVYFHTLFTKSNRTRCDICVGSRLRSGLSCPGQGGFGFVTVLHQVSWLFHYVFNFMLENSYVVQGGSFTIKMENEKFPDVKFVPQSHTIERQGQSITVFKPQEGAKKKNAYFCTGCKYLVTLEAQEGSVFEIESYAYSVHRPIKFGEIKYDSLVKNAYTIFELDASEHKNLIQ